MIFPSYMRVHVPGSPPFHPLTLPSSRALCRSGKLPQRTYSGFLDRVRSCISLDRDPALQAQGLQVPRSARTIWKILRAEGLILASPAARHKPLPPREPLEEVQIDFKDVTTVPADPDGKRQHVVETCNFVDAGTSILLEAQVRDDFRAETAFDAVVAFLRRYGLPPMLTFDRDPRWVGSQSGRDFPSALRRLLLCLGVEPHVCPPQQPQKNAFVERFHRSYKYACLLVHRPGTRHPAIEVTQAYQQHYNWERPRKATSVPQPSASDRLSRPAGSASIACRSRS
jgi:transposase InsO family protein